MTTRRNFMSAAISAAVAGNFCNPLANGSELASETHAPPAVADREVIAMLLYDGFTLLDLFGPHHMFILMDRIKVELVAPTLDPITSETGIKIAPTLAFSDCPDQLTALFVPGGSAGTLAAMKNPAIRNFLREKGRQAQWIASVCTGSLLLGASGLLEGYRATSHWLARPSLSEFGATPVDARVVVDRNRITGAGVTAGIDLGLQLVGELRGEFYAQGAQLFAEYDPHPPYQAGSCEKAPPEVVTMLKTMHASLGQQISDIARELRDQE